jgi:Family of unknown function (DUF6744)
MTCLRSKQSSQSGELMNNKTSFSDLSSVQTSTEKMPLVGYTVFWRLAGIRVKRDELAQALDQAGLIDFLPKPPTPRLALRRALEHWLADKKRQSGVTAPDELRDEDEEQHTLIRVINRAGSEHLVFALVAENVDFASLGLSYGTSFRILLHKKTGEMIVTNEASGVINALNESRQLAVELAPYWDEYKDKFISRDLSQMMREIVDRLNATGLRQSGGVYFVPVSERELLSRMREMIEQLPRVPETEPFVCALGIPDAEEAKRGLAQAVHAGIMDEIRLMKVDLERLGEAEGKVREKTITQRMLVYKRLKAKAEIYEDLLDMQQDQVRAAIANLETEARNLLMSGEAESLTPSGAETPATLFAEPERTAA